MIKEIEHSIKSIKISKEQMALEKERKFSNDLLRCLRPFSQFQNEFKSSINLVIQNALVYDHNAGLIVKNEDQVISEIYCWTENDRKTMKRLLYEVEFVTIETAVKDKISKKDEELFCDCWFDFLKSNDHDSFIRNIFELTMFYIPMKEKRNPRLQQNVKLIKLWAAIDDLIRLLKSSSKYRSYKG